MVQRVEAFVYNMLVNVLNPAETAPLAIEAILSAGSHDPGPKARQIENPADWTPEKISAAAATLETDKGEAGDFDD
jgi:hypothetical protein